MKDLTEEYRQDYVHRQDYRGIRIFDFFKRLEHKRFIKRFHFYDFDSISDIMENFPKIPVYNDFPKELPHSILGICDFPARLRINGDKSYLFDYFGEIGIFPSLRVKAQAQLKDGLRIRNFMVHDTSSKHGPFACTITGTIMLTDFEIE